MKVNDVIYFVSNNWTVHEGIITHISGDFCTIRYDGYKGIRLRKNRLFDTKEDAVLHSRKTPPPKRYLAPPKEH